jgi:hypothetical protein
MTEKPKESSNFKNVELLEKILREYPWDEEALSNGATPTLDLDTARRRAIILAEDAGSLGIDWPIRVTGGEHNLLLPYYDIPGTEFGATDSATAKEVEKAHGFGLNWGSLVRLSKACEIGRTQFGDEWPTKFKGQLTNPKDHLSIVEEILWLGLWQQTRALEREARPFQRLGNTKRVDWRFDCCGQIINLEIKYRPRDWIRHVDGSKFSRVFDSYYHDVPAKFPTRNEGELNIVGISSLASEDRHWSLVTEKLLKTHTEIDAVILWAHHTESGGPFRIHSLKKDFIDLFFTGGTVEDAAHFGLVRHLWRSRDERRAMRAEEAIPILVHQLQAERS